MSAAAWRGRRIGRCARKACIRDGACGRADHVFVHVSNGGADRKTGRLLPARGWRQLTSAIPCYDPPSGRNLTLWEVADVAPGLPQCLTSAQTLIKKSKLVLLANEIPPTMLRRSAISFPAALGATTE